MIKSNQKYVSYNRIALKRMKIMDGLFNNLQICDIEKTLKYKNDDSDIINSQIFDYIYTQLVKIQKDVLKVGSNNFVINQTCYCVRTNNKEGYAFGAIPNEIKQKKTKIIIIAITNKNKKDIRIDYEGKKTTEKKDSFSYDKNKWDSLPSKSENDDIIKMIVGILRDYEIEGI